MASGRRRRRRRRLRGALGGEARPLGSHQPRGGEEGAGASLGPARVTCPKHVHVTRAPRPSRWPMRGDVGSSVRGDSCSHSSRLLGRLTPPGTAPLSTRSRLLRPPPFPFRRGCCSQPIGTPYRHPLAATQLSAVNQQTAGHQSPAVSQPVSPQAELSIPSFVCSLVPFIRLANILGNPPLLCPGSVPSPGEGPG